jgi:signal transduction histidine kinase
LQEKQIQRKNFLIAVLVGSFAITIALVMLGLIARRNRRQKHVELLRRRFTQQLLQNTEQERSRIAGELHDGITHELLTLKNTLHNGINFSEIKIDRIINDIRRISRNLHPVMLDKIGLKLSIENLCGRYMKDERLFVMTDINYDKQLSPGGELQLYRIIQEALNNIEKYAGAHAARIVVEPQGHLLIVSIKDNGKGFDVPETLSDGSAFGLYSIIERSKALGGKASISSGADGTNIRIEIPIQHG